MQSRFPLSLSAAALAVFCFAACDNASDPAVSQSQIDADLKTMASKVRYFSPNQSTHVNGNDGLDGALKRAADDCIMEGHRIDDYTDTTAAGVETYIDTSDSYTTAGKLVCDEEDQTAYTVSGSYQRNTMYESWFHSRMDFGITPETLGNMSVKGSGRVHYLSGYDLDITSFEAAFDLNGGIKKLEYSISLEGGRYQTVLTPNPAWNPMQEGDPDPAMVVLSGPIKNNGQVVGYFEVMGNDSVVIRDAEKKVVAVHN